MTVARFLSAMCIVTALMAAGIVQHASAANRTWVSTTSGADVTVGTSNWSSNAVPGSGDKGLFNQGNGGTGSAAVTDPTVTGTSFNPGSLAFQNVSGSNVSISGTGTITIGKMDLNTNNFIYTTSSGAAIFNNAELDFNTGNSGIYTSGISGGDVTVNTTVFKMGLGAATGSKNFLAATSTNTITINPSVNLSAISADQPLTLVAHNNGSGNGTVNLAAGITGSGSFTTNVTINDDLGDDPDQIGSVIIGGTSNFAGTTIIGDGTASRAGTATFTGLYNGSGTTTVNSFATIAGGGTISGAVVVSGIAAPGNTAGTAGTLTVGGLSLNGGSSVTMDLQNTAGLHAPGGGLSDLIAVSGTLGLAGTPININLAAVGGGPVGVGAGGTWTLATYSAISGGVPTFNFTGVASGYTPSINLDTPGQVNLVLTAVPEPSTFVLAGLGLLGFAVVRIRKRK